MTWNDLPALLSSDSQQSSDDEMSDPSESAASYSKYTPLTLIRHLLQRYVELKTHEVVAVSLWVLHTFVFERFMITPRLILTSPVRGCGKTTLIDFLEALTSNPHKTDNASAAGLYHLIDRQRPTLLLDEGDNQDLHLNSVMRSVLNSGHRRGGSVTRYIDGESRKLRTFAPLALAAISGAVSSLPLPFLDRSIMIQMERHDGKRKLNRFDHDDTNTKADLNTVFKIAFQWASSVELNTDPDMPKELRNRVADNWRVLISIADACGEEWGKAARDAATTFCRERNDEDSQVLALYHLRDLFRAKRVDRLLSKEAVECLNAMEDAIWSEWRGIRGDGPPHKLRQAELASLLRPFGIRPRSIWPLRRVSGESSGKGYLEIQFAKAWATYCPEDGTAAHAGNIRRLHRQ